MNENKKLIFPNDDVDPNIVEIPDNILVKDLTDINVVFYAETLQESKAIVRWIRKSIDKEEWVSVRTVNENGISFEKSQNDYMLNFAGLNYWKREGYNLLSYKDMISDDFLERIETITRGKK